MANDIVNYQNVITDIKGIISSGREVAYNAANKAMVLTYWHVGKRIVEQEQAGKERAKYGQALIEALADELTKEYGKSFSKRNLQYFRKFYLAFPDEQIVNACVHNLNWTHFRALLRVEDGIDSSKDAGKLMISVLSAVAEIERENILVQTMEGRRQKAREGRWNGGFAPYGYQLVNGELIIAEDEAEIIRIIYDKFVNTTMGMAAIAAFLNNSGYKKKLRQNNTTEGFSTSFVKGVLDNPIYCGKLAFGRRKNEKIPGTRNEYHIVKQKEYMLNDGIHEAIILEEMWNQAHRKRQETGVLQVKTHSLEHEHILSGIIKCPVCGSGMYGNVNRKKHPDGGYYKVYFYYACKHRKLVDGHRCTYKRQWNEDRINAAVEEIIRKFVKNPKFEQEIRKQIGSSIDTLELDKEYDGLKDRLSQTTGAKNRLADQMDHLSVSDKNYDKKYNDMQERLDKLYDEITDIENAMEEVETRLYNIRQDKISEDNVYQFLLFFDKLYDKFTDLEKKTFLKSFLSDVFIYEEEQKDGRILKGLRFKFPIYMNGRNVLGVDWDNGGIVTCR